MSSPPTAIDGATLDFMMSHRKPAIIIGLYCMFARYENQTVRGEPITIKQLQEMSGLSESAFYRYKDEMEVMKLIKMKQIKIDGVNVGWSVHIRTVDESRTRTHARGPQHKSDSSPTPSPPFGGKRGGRRGEVSRSCSLLDEILNPSQLAKSWQHQCAQRLLNMLTRRRKVMTKHINMKSWSRHFTILDNAGYTRKHITRVLNWYCIHFGEDFVPDARSAGTFASKFARIEAAMDRYLKNNKQSDVKMVYVDDDADQQDASNPIVSDGTFDPNNLNGKEFIGG